MGLVRCSICSSSLGWYGGGAGLRGLVRRGRSFFCFVRLVKKPQLLRRSFLFLFFVFVLPHTANFQLLVCFVSFCYLLVPAPLFFRIDTHFSGADLLASLSSSIRSFSGEDFVQL